MFARTGQRRKRGQPYKIHLEIGRAARDPMETARKPRLVFAGAIYHVLSRGNYRKELFDDDSATLFDKTLFQASAKCS